MDLLEAVWVQMISDKVRNVFVMAGVLIALLSFRESIELAKKKQSSDLVFAGRNDKDFVGGIAALKRRKQAGDIKELAFARNYGQQDALSVFNGWQNVERCQPSRGGSCAGLSLKQGAEPPVCAALLKPPPLLPNPGPGACGVNQ
jgi:hypothetical protein